MNLDPAGLLRATPRSFALVVHDQSMVGAGICQGDIVVGEFTPQARAGAIVVALIDGDAVVRRLVVNHGQAYLASDQPYRPERTAIADVVIQGVVHTLVRRLT